MEPGWTVLRRGLWLAGRELSLETGRVARQAGGSVLARYGDTVVLVTATSSATPREGIDFFPLTVDYEERHYSVGKIPGGFIKREGRPSERAILSARLIDRPIRPLFPKNYRNDVHVVATVMSVDQDNPPDVVAMVGASAALMLSGIPFAGPIGAVAVGLVNGELVVNPRLEEAQQSLMHLVVAGTRDAVMMVEAGAKEVPEETVLEGIMLGHRHVQEIVRFIEEFRAEAEALGLAKPLQEVPAADWKAELEPLVREMARGPLEEVIRQGALERWGKKEREARLDEAKERLLAEFAERHPEVAEEHPDYGKAVADLILKVEKEVVRRMVTRDRLRVDGRALDEIRPVWCQTGVLPRTHGSGLFTRGETQVLTITTLGMVSEEQILDGLGVEESKRYMHHYNMPPYSVGEARPIRGPGRREIGHGALAERALEAVLPDEESFPYTIRLVSEVVGSNGSTSMGSVCGSTLSLMDAGVPIKAPVAGVAMGLVKEEDSFAVLTDIQGIEDALGDMDFKVAGTEKGITALQMDIKIAGINRDILAQALEQARQGRLFILSRMLEELPAPRPELSPYAPRIITTRIDPDKIRDVIGPGGKVIRRIIEETGTEIDVEDDGRIFIGAQDAESGNKALQIIQALTGEVEVGKLYNGRVTRITDFGAFVEVIPGVLGLPGKEGLVHISQMAEGRIDKVEDVVKEGEYLLVKAIGFDPQGRLRLSHKEAVRGEKAAAEGGGGGPNWTRPPRHRDRERGRGARGRGENR